MQQAAFTEADKKRVKVVNFVAKWLNLYPRTVGSLQLLFSLSWTDSIPAVDDVYDIANTFDAFNSSTKGPLNTFQCVVLSILSIFKV